jgi:glutaredoxin
MISLIPRWVRSSRAADASHLTVTVYTRAQCCCCHKALEVLHGFQGRYGFHLEEVDVDSDLALVAEYGLSVPVVAVNDKVRFKGVVNPALLERLLVAEGRGR